MPAYVRDKVARPARWLTMSRKRVRTMCSCNRMISDLLSEAGAGENTSSKRTVSMSPRSIAPLPLTKLGCGTA